MAVTDLKKYNLELLSPAGSFEAAKAAVNAGADAIYMGGPLFSARAYAESSVENEEKSQLLQAIEYCHLRGVKVYMTLNILMKEKEMAGLFEYMKPYAEAGVDAVIVQDMGVMLFIKKHFPDINIHISTQAAVTGPRYAKLLKNAGAKRVVPARELSLQELRRIKEEADIEVEAFVHGALCYSYSGQCLMSSMIGGRSGNRGRCAGTCRLPVDVYDDKKRKINAEDEQYILSMKDLCGIRKIKEMADAGVCSYKIEGRMKSPLYVAGVTSIYRKYFDALPGLPDNGKSLEEDERLLREVFDRGGSTDGYLNGHNGRNMISLYEKKTRIPDKDFVQEITEKYLENDMLIPVKVSFQARLNEKPVLTLCAVLNRKKTSAGSETFAEKSTEKYTEEYKEEYKEEYTDNPGLVKKNTVEVRLTGDFTVEKAGNRPVTREDLLEKLNKFGGTDFIPESIDIEIDEGIFIPMKSVNELRRNAAAELRKKMLQEYIEKNAIEKNKQEECPKLRNPQNLEELQNPEELLEEKRNKILDKGLYPENSQYTKDTKTEPETCASVETYDQLNACLAEEKVSLIYIESGLFDAEKWPQTAEKIHEKGKRAGLRLPHIFRLEAERFFKVNIEKLKDAGFDVFLIRNFETYLWLKEKGLPDFKQTELVFDHSIYSFNSFSDEMIAELIEHENIRLTAPLEENYYEINAEGKELTVYGRSPMMVSAQCIKKTVSVCEYAKNANTAEALKGKRFEAVKSRDSEHSQNNVVYLKDRTGALMPVKNICAFCYNTIYNNVPLAIFDMKDEIRKLGPAFLRYEFTTESKREVSEILSQKMPPQGAFTRGHFKKSVE